jgi:hypothetical protein
MFNKEKGSTGVGLMGGGELRRDNTGLVDRSSVDKKGVMELFGKR